MNPVQRLRKTGNGTPPNLERLITDFVRWAAAETDAKTIGEAIARANSDGGPLEPWEHLASFEIGEATDDLQHPYAIIADWRAKLDEREIKIFDSRIAAEPATATLQEVGDEFGLTRERIRQIERGVKEQLASLVRSQTGAPIRWRMETLKKETRSAAPLNLVKTLLARERKRNSPDYRNLLLKVAGPYDLVNRWIVLRERRGTDPTEMIVASTDEFNCIDMDFATDELNAWGLRPELHTEWLQRDGRIVRINDHLVRWDTRVEDKLVFALFDIGEPSTLDELINHINWVGARATCLNAASRDERIVRSSQHQLGLKSWGGDEYVSIPETMRRVLAAENQPMRVSELARKLKSERGFNERSVFAFSYAPMFFQRGGWVRVRGEDEPYDYEGVSINDASGVFYLGRGRTSLLFKIDGNATRGSGRPLTYAVGKILKIEVDGDYEFQTTGGASLRITFPRSSSMGPTLGSTREILEAVQAKHGDWITLLFDKTEMSVEARITDVSSSAPSWELVARLTGINPKRGSTELAMALGCDPDDIRPTLLHRNDLVVANALP